MSDLPIIHTSDRLSFKRCRRRWDWSSDLRQGYKPFDTPQPLYFGTAVHAGLQVYCEPKTWHLLQNPESAPLVHAATIKAFQDSLLETKKRYLKVTGKVALDPEQKETWDAELELGKGMLKGYFEWAPSRDKGYKSIAVEIIFLVPVFDPETGVQIAWYQGRVDWLVQDSDGFYWIVDHKTTSRWDDRMTFLELDEQMGSYIWALRNELKLNIIGAMYNELYKAYPEEPAENKVCRQGRWFSVNKSQATSYDVYKKTVMERDATAYSQGLYDPFLQYLKAEGIIFFKRTQIHRSLAEMRNQGITIGMETLDMLENPRIYPSPTRFSCDQCPFRGPCVAKNADGDFEYLLKENYIREDRT